MQITCTELITLIITVSKLNAEIKGEGFTKKKKKKHRKEHHTSFWSRLKHILLPDLVFISF